MTAIKILLGLLLLFLDMFLLNVIVDLLRRENTLAVCGGVLIFIQVIILNYLLIKNHEKLNF